METRKHTPGPWRVGDAGFTVFGPPSGKPSPETVANVRKKANSHLIAAAVEMLEALKALDLECSYDLLNPCTLSKIPGRHWSGISKACPACCGLAAIAKAEGGAHE